MDVAMYIARFGYLRPVFLQSYAYIDDISVDECGVLYVVLNCCILSALDPTKKINIFVVVEGDAFSNKARFWNPLKKPLWHEVRKLDKRIDLVRGATSKSGGVLLTWNG